MAFQKGHKLAGSRKGVPNKRTVEAMEIAQRLKCDPLEVLLLFAKNDWKSLGYDGPTSTRMANETVIDEPTITPELRASCAGKACEYIYPKRKAIEQSLSDGTITHITRTILSKAIGG